MTFERPVLFWALGGVVLLAALALRERKNLRRALDRWSRVGLVATASRPASAWYALAQLLLLAGGFACAAIGFAGPILSETVAEPVWENVFIGLLVDVSRSTTAPLEPRAVNSLSRWDAMQRGLLEFLEQTPPGLKVSALAFTDVAVPLMLTPTDDHLEVAAKIRRLDHRFITRQGTNFAEAIRAGAAAFDELNDRSGTRIFSLILISDGDAELTPVLDAELARVRYPVYAIGVGSPEPVYIPDPGSPSGYLEKAGEPAQTVLREDTLAYIAKRTGGQYYPFRKRGELLQLLGRIVDQLGKRTTRTVVHDRRIAVWFFAAAFVLLVLHQRPAAPWRRPSVRRAPEGATATRVRPWPAPRARETTERQPSARAIASTRYSRCAM